MRPKIAVLLEELADLTKKLGTSGSTNTAEPVDNAQTTT